MREPDPRASRVEVVHRDGRGLEEERQGGRQPCLDQVLDDLGLAIDHDRPSGELVHRDVVALTVELQVDPAVDDPVATHSFPDARVAQQVDRPLLEHAGADAVLDVLAAAALEHDRLDPLACEQLGQRQARRARADDSDLRPHPSSSTRCATANAEFAAGTPQ